MTEAYTADLLYLFPGIRWDEIEDLLYELWLDLKARVDVWRQRR